MRIVTIVCRSEIARARVLAASIVAHTGMRLEALLLDGAAEDRAHPEPFAVRLPEDVGLAEVGLAASHLTRAALREWCKPALLAHALASEPEQPVLYLDPDSLVCGPLEDLDALAREHGVLVRPRTTRALSRSAAGAITASSSSGGRRPPVRAARSTPAPSRSTASRRSERAPTSCATTVSARRSGICTAARSSPTSRAS